MNKADAREHGIISILVRKLLSYMKDVKVNLWHITYIDEHTIEIEYIVPVT